MFAHAAVKPCLRSTLLNPGQPQRTTPNGTSASRRSARGSVPGEDVTLPTESLPPKPHARAEKHDAELPGQLPIPEIPNYEILSIVGHGGMGAVLRARHRVLNRIVAIKLPLGFLPSTYLRFLTEARSAARLRHPHICTIHEVGDVEGRPYIVMDFIAGPTLKDWAASHPPSARHAAEIVAKLARAVDYAHEHGVIHRDLKPANVIIEAEWGEPVLMDFGLAKEITQSTSDLTQTGDVMGTPAYMAPEQAAGRHEQVGPRSDVYALGVVLYDLLCGCPPFQGAAGEVLRRVQTEDPPAPRTHAPRLHRDLETICLKAMAKDPTDRYLSAAALADDLERFIAGEQSWPGDRGYLRACGARWRGGPRCRRS